MFLILVTTTFVGFCIVILSQLWKEKFKKLPPGPLRIPLLGNMLQIVMADPKFYYIALEKFSKKYGDIAFVQLGVSPTVGVTGYEAIKEICSSDDFFSRPRSKPFLDRTYGKPLGLSLVHGKVWRDGRKFSMTHLKRFGYGKNSVMDSALRREFVELSKMLEKKTEKTNGVINTHNLFFPFFFNCVWRTVSGIRYDYEDPKFIKLVKYSHDWLVALSFGAGILTVFPFLAEWAPKITKFDVIQDLGKNIRVHLEEFLTERRATGNYLKSPEAFVDVYLKEIELQKNNPENEAFTDENLVCIIMDIFMGGGDTSSALANFALLYLIRYPDVQDKLRNEIDNVIGKVEWPSIEDKPQLPYVNAFILELLRVANVVAIVPRSVLKDTAFREYIIPKDTDVILSLYSVHMDKLFWGDPENFRPSRFLNDECEILPEYEQRIIPFGLGKKNCFGDKIAQFDFFMFITRLVQQYTFAVPGNKEDIVLGPMPGIIQSPPPCEVVIKRRK